MKSRCSLKMRRKITQKDIELSKLAKWMLKQYEDAETKGLGNSVLSQRLDPALMNR